MSQSLSCHIRHNTARATLAEVLQEVCSDDKVESQLIPVTGEISPAGSNVTDNATSDVIAVGLWQPLNREFIDVMVFNPHAPSNAAISLKSRKRQDASRILQVEKGTFSLAVFTCSG